MGRKPELYDLDSDIGELADVGPSYPDLVRELQELIARYDADLKVNSRPIWRSGDE